MMRHIENQTNLSNSTVCYVSLKLIIIMCELLQSGKIEIGHRQSVLYADWPLLRASIGILGLQVLAVIHIRGVAAIANILSIALNGLMFWTIESSQIIGNDHRSCMATTRHCTLHVCGKYIYIYIYIYIYLSKMLYISVFVELVVIVRNYFIISPFWHH